MSLKENLILVRETFFNKVENLFIDIASVLGFPENPGMPLVPPNGYLGQSFFENDSLPLRKVPFPPQGAPQNLIEMIIGCIPKVNPVDRMYFESTTDGFYNYYIENYKNLFFLPNWLSEILQVRFGFCIDITFLEVFREVLFVSIMGFAEIVTLRILLSWILSINPYTSPWNYFIALVDWTEETLIGLVPTVVGVNLSGPILTTLLGKAADTLNHLVFTMPFLPSEGEPAKMEINGQVKDILVFRYLPILWYKHPIPNEIREFWYTERPDILKYMETAYKDLDIQFLPDRIIEEMNLKQLGMNEVFDQVSSNQDFNHSLSTNLISNTNLNQVHEFSNYLIQVSENLSNFVDNFNS